MEFVKLVGPFGTIFIMFALGLNLNINDFTKVIKKPNNLIIGLISQLVILPLIGLILVKAYPMREEFQLGVFLLLILPSAVMSNYATKLISGNVALSIILTSVCALFSFIIGLLSLRTSGVYFIMITLAFAQMLYFFSISWPNYGGEDGLSIYMRNSFPMVNTMDPLSFYVISLFWLLFSIFIGLPSLFLTKTLA